MRNIQFPLLFLLSFAVNFFLIGVPGAQSFIVAPGADSEDTLKKDVLMPRVLDTNWNIIYGFAGDCPSKKETAEIQAAIAAAIPEALQTWLAPLKDQEEGHRLVQRFTVYYSPIAITQEYRPRRYFEAAPDGFIGVKRKKVHLQAGFSCDPAVSLREIPFVATGASEIHLRPVLETRGQHCIPHTNYITRDLLHELGHSFGLPDKYYGPRPPHF